MAHYLISNSEVTDFLTCKRKHLNAYQKKIEKRRKGKALTLGIVGHDVFKLYYETRMKGGGHEEAVSNANAILTSILHDRSQEFGLDNLILARRLITNYFDHYGADSNWTILEVEQFHRLPITNQIAMPMRLDLLVQEVHSGKILIVDTKFTYEFYSDDDLILRPQFPKYFAALKANGINVDGVIVNQIRTRPIKEATPEQLYRRAIVPMSDNKIRNVLQSHLTTAKQIVAFKQLSREQQEQLAVPLQNEKICQFCSFKGLCIAELEGADTDILLNEQFQKKTYGYTDEEK